MSKNAAVKSLRERKGVAYQAWRKAFDKGEAPPRRVAIARAKGRRSS